MHNTDSFERIRAMKIETGSSAWVSIRRFDTGSIGTRDMGGWKNKVNFG